MRRWHKRRDGSSRRVSQSASYAIELLERRVMLSGAPVDSGVFARYSGQVPPGGSAQITFDLNPFDAKLPGGSVVFGFQAISGGALDPSAVQLTDASGRAISPVYANPDLGGTSESLAFFKLSDGAYTLGLSGDRGISGPFSLDAILVGDVNGDGQVVNNADYFLFNRAFGTALGDSRYNPAADFNLDGKINNADYFQLNRNIGVHLMTPPAAPTFALSSADASGAGSTSHEIVTLTGTTSPGAVVSLASQNLSTTAAADGSFTLHGVLLGAGDNAIALTATDGFGNSAPSAPVHFTRAAPVSPAQVVLDWNQVVLNAIQLDDSNPEYASRALAIVHAAIYDAVNSIDQAGPSLYVHLSAPADASDAAAVSQAAHDALSYLYPAQQAIFDAKLASELSSLPDGASKSDGLAVGQSVAAAIIAMRQNDGSTAFVDYTPSSAPGLWQPTYPDYMPAQAPQWANLTPFVMSSPSQFRPPGPTALGSAQYNADVQQVQSLGKVNSTTRTPDQTQAARFWNDAAGSFDPPGHWNQIATQVAAQKGLGLFDTAKLLAELNVGMGDAAIVAWDAKFAYNFWRPIQAIQQANSVPGDTAITQDATWYPLITTPPFPEYVSGHSTFSGTAATILDSFFGPDTPFTISSVGLPGVTRGFSGFDAAAQEAALSRLWGGIHFMTSINDGLAAGKQLANLVLQRFAEQKDTQPPSITITSPQLSTQNPALSTGSVAQPPSAVVLGAPPTVTGQVTDNLSGVASLMAALDAGAFVSVPFDASGHFSIPVGVSGDGPHVLHLKATDYAGNSTPSTGSGQAVDFNFILDTALPTISITSPALPSGQTSPIPLSSGAILSGSASGTGSALIALSYAFDNGMAMPLSFGSTGSPQAGADGGFNQPLDLSHLSPGNHVLLIRATDAAGNTATTMLAVSLARMIPLTLAGFEPSSGAGDVGVTFRPKIVFSRAIDPTTLTSADFFATDTTGTKLPATIVPSDDGTYAWLFFASPMPGASMITITVDGSAIKAPDGALLDAANTGTPGGKLAFSFQTVSTAALPTTTITDASGHVTQVGTSLSGIVADPGPDLQPGSLDDVSPGPDGIRGTADDVYKLPIAGVTVTIVGTSLTTITDANGHFSFPSIPAGDVKLDVDGTTATPTTVMVNGVPMMEPPAGVYFPTMVMDLNILPGQPNTVMAAMQRSGTGNNQPGATLPSAPGVYLPRVQSSILTPIAPTGMTHIGVDAASAPDLTPQQRQMLSINVPGGVAIGMTGQKMSAFKVGISVVPPQLVMDMLPPGLMQHTFDITVQAPGVATFTTPVPMTFPNVFNAAPGTKLNFLSFDHTTGRLVIEGTATVSADGLSATTDPGTGITHPGWHGLTPPGSNVKPPPPLPPLTPPNPCLVQCIAMEDFRDAILSAAICGTLKTIFPGHQQLNDLARLRAIVTAAITMSY